MPNALYDEAASRQAGVAPPSYLTAAPSGGGWQGTIGGTRMVLGGLPSSATQAEAEAYYRNSPSYQRSTGGGYLSGNAYAALNPNASASELANYDQFYRTAEDKRNRNIQQGFGSNPLTTIGAFIAAAAGGAYAAGGASAFGGGASAAGGGAAAGGAAGGGASLGSTVGGTVGGSFSGGSLAGAGAGAGAGGAAGAGAAGGAGGLGIFANGGAGGLAGVGGGSAGGLAASGGIAGGAGVGGTTAGALGGLGGLGSSLGGASSAGGYMGWGDWVNLAGQLYGSYAQGQGASNASRAEQRALQAGIDEQRRQFDLTRADQAPWLATGTAALGRLNDPTAFTASPSYNFVKNEALGGVQNSAAARGGLYSGNTYRALQDRAANVASQEYGNWFNQQSNLAGLGQASAQSLGSLGQNNANNVSNLLGQQGNARASGVEGRTNALTGGISDFLSWYNRRGYGS